MQVHSNVFEWAAKESSINAFNIIKKKKSIVIVKLEEICHHSLDRYSGSS